MKKFVVALAAHCFLISICMANAADPPKLSAQASQAAAQTYLQYCALCHGDDRQGHVNDHAPSLRSKSLMSSGYPDALLYAIEYGRLGTPMAPFLDEVGGPLTRTEIHQLTDWLRSQVDVAAAEISMRPVDGDTKLGASVFARECAGCHGANGEGDTGTALGNQPMLNFAHDDFLRYAIVNGRDGTNMPAFAGKLSVAEIDAVTSYLRSKSTGWTIEKPVYRQPPTAGDYILNPEGEAPKFKLKDGLYVMSKDLDEALRSKRRLVLLDTRASLLWQLANIEGSVPLPYYYKDVDALTKDLPKDGTMIVTYCECPRAAAESVNRKLRARGFTSTAVLWEGIQGWIALGYPVTVGETTPVVVGAE